MGNFAQKNPPGKSVANSSKIYATKIPDTFLHRGWAKISASTVIAARSCRGFFALGDGWLAAPVRFPLTLSRVGPYVVALCVWSSAPAAAGPRKDHLERAFNSMQNECIVQEPKKEPQSPKNRMNSTKELSEQFEGATQ